jgi:hypothetical protein
MCDVFHDVLSEFHCFRRLRLDEAVKNVSAKDKPRDDG